MLAHSLATNGDHTAAFAAYERDVREFVAMNQALVDNGGATLFPTTVRALEQRNAMLRDLVTMPSPTARPAHSALTLPEFAPDYGRRSVPPSGAAWARPVR
jgi:2-polyprenyl-6-methoxyphenol hydroxylase-like FAD-dependent oxidoreductase